MYSVRLNNIIFGLCSVKESCSYVLDWRSGEGAGGRCVLRKSKLFEAVTAFLSYRIHKIFRKFKVNVNEITLEYIFSRCPSGICLRVLGDLSYEINVQSMQRYRLDRFITRFVLNKKPGTLTYNNFLHIVRFLLYYTPQEQHRWFTFSFSSSDSPAVSSVCFLASCSYLSWLVRYSSARMLQFKITDI